jgi:hypothetical protein
MTIKLITFKTNHTILAQTDEELANIGLGRFKIKQPVQVVVQPTKEGPMMGFSPFLDYAEEFNLGIEINKSDVLCVTTPSRELENQYNQVFGSGIQIASAIPKV